MFLILFKCIEEYCNQLWLHAILPVPKQVPAVRWSRRASSSGELPALQATQIHGHTHHADAHTQIHTVRHRQTQTRRQRHRHTITHIGTQTQTQSGTKRHTDTNTGTQTHGSVLPAGPTFPRLLDNLHQAPEPVRQRGRRQCCCCHPCRRCCHTHLRLCCSACVRPHCTAHDKRHRSAGAHVKMEPSNTVPGRAAPALAIADEAAGMNGGAL